MVDLPTFEQVTTGAAGGGIIGAITITATWLIKRFAGAITQGEELAERRITNLTTDIKEFRRRAEEDRVNLHTEVKALRLEVDDITSDLAAAREQLRACKAESHEMRVELDRLRTEVARLTAG